MKRFKKSLAMFAMIGLSVAAWEGGAALIENVQFARAEAKVESSREQLQKVEDLSTVFRNVAKVIEPSVVQIQVEKTIKGGRQRSFGPNDDFLRKFFRDHGGGEMPPTAPDNQGDGADNGSADNSPDLKEQGTGSGVIMQVDGSDAYIVTNNHVAGGATELTVTLADGRVIKHGKTIGADPKSDLAVVKISADHLMPAKWGSSDELERGDWVLAFGSPFGYVGSMTHGIVSALNRQAGILGKMGYEHFIQVDAPINPGNSGGPLVNIHGEVIGINTAIATQSGGFQGIGFAIPSAEARSIVATLQSKGKITRGWLGVEIANVKDGSIQDPRVPENELKNLGFTGDKGVYVGKVLRDTPAFGKLQPNDIITGLSGKPAEGTEQLREQVAATAPGSDLQLQVFRDHKTQDVTIKIGEQPEDMDSMASAGQDGAGPRSHGSQSAQALGMRLTNVTDELADKNGLGDVRDGALVTNVIPGSLAEKSGISVGDLITRVNGESVSNAAQTAEAIAKQDLSKGVTLSITNHEGSSIVFLQK